MCANYGALHEASKLDLLFSAQEVRKRDLAANLAVIPGGKGGAREKYNSLTARMCGFFSASVFKIAKFYNSKVAEADKEGKCGEFIPQRLDSVAVEVDRNHGWLDNVATFAYDVTATVRFQTGSSGGGSRLYEVGFVYSLFDRDAVMEPPPVGEEGDVGEGEGDESAGARKEGMTQVYSRDVAELSRYKRFESCTPAGVDPMFCNCEVS